MAKPLSLRPGATTQLLLPAPGSRRPSGDVRATSSRRRRTAPATPGRGSAGGTEAGATSGAADHRLRAGNNRYEGERGGAQDVLAGRLVERLPQFRDTPWCQTES